MKVKNDFPQLLEENVDDKPLLPVYLQVWCIRIGNALDQLKMSKWWRIEAFLLLAAVFFGCLSSLLSEVSRSRSQERLSEIYATRRVLVIKSELRAGEVIQRTAVGSSDALVNSSSDNFASEQSLDSVIGKRSLISLVPGDPILLSALEASLNDQKMAERIPPGKRLFTLSTNDIAAGKGVIKPNDHVDILTHMDLPERGLTTFTLLQDVTLVSVGASSVLDDDHRGGRDVSFFIDSSQAEMMSFAQSRGQFFLSLRNDSDLGQIEGLKGIDLKDFLDNEKLYGVTGGSPLDVIAAGKKIKH